MTLSDDDGDGMDLFAVQEFFGDTDAVEAADLPGRGQGLVASRDIAAGEALVCETALASCGGTLSLSSASLHGRCYRSRMALCLHRPSHPPPFI